MKDLYKEPYLYIITIGYSKKRTS